jgi:hypothetical protein
MRASLFARNISSLSFAAGHGGAVFHVTKTTAKTTAKTV